MWNYHINFDYCWQKKRHGKALFCKWLIFAILRSCGTNINLVLVIYVKYVYHVWSLRVKKWGKFKIVNLNILKIWNQISWRYNLQFLRYRVWQTEIGIGNYGSFFSLLPHPLKPPKNRILGGKKCWRYHFTHVYVILGHFLPFYPLTTRKINISKKMKKSSGDVIILHLCTKNHNHMMYASWHMECNRHTFLSFWAIFGLLPHYWLWKL